MCVSAGGDQGWGTLGGKMGPAGPTGQAQSRKFHQPQSQARCPKLNLELAQRTDTDQFPAAGMETVTTMLRL